MGCREFDSIGLLFFRGGRFGSTNLAVSGRICDVQKSRRSEERCAAVLFGFVMVICIYAPGSAKDLEEYEKFMGEMTKVLHEGR